MIVKRHAGQLEAITCLSDSSLIGNKYEDENLQLDLTSDFYKGEEMQDEEKIIKLIKSSNIINVIGEESIAFVIKHNFASQSQIKRIADIPYLIIIL